MTVLRSSISTGMDGHLKLFFDDLHHAADGLTWKYQPGDNNSGFRWRFASEDRVGVRPHGSTSQQYHVAKQSGVAWPADQHLFDVVRVRNRKLHLALPRLKEGFRRAFLAFVKELRT